MPDAPDSTQSKLICKSLGEQTAKDLLVLHQRMPQRYPALLESVQQPEGEQAFDILFAFPQGFLKYQNSKLSICANLIDGLKIPNDDKFLSVLDKLWTAQGCSYDQNEYSFLPFKGGWFLYLGYEMVQEIEPSLKNIPETDEPCAFALRIPAAIIHSHSTQQYYLLVEPQYKSLLQVLEQDFHDMENIDQFNSRRSEANSIVLHEDKPEAYLSGIQKIKQYIKDGDIFQANLSRAWSANVGKDYSTVSLYQRLKHENPAPFAGIAQFEDFSIISSSPERLLKVSEQKIQTRPIAGTYPRSKEPEKDRQYSADLILHPKERAEHIMLVDLERNDLGRLCEYGSIVVDEMMVVESYTHVHHIVSNISGVVRQGITPGEIIAALFPGGTITGCPKVRCMEILFELEKQSRGAYTGSMGYLNHDGDMDLNILIRTIVKYQNQVCVRAGAGIVADSQPLRELEETRSKAKGMLKALNFIRQA